MRTCQREQTIPSFRQIWRKLFLYHPLSQIKLGVLSFHLVSDMTEEICCPFHQDKQPSMKVDDRYYCFSCHQTGDVIDFVGRLFGLTPYQAALKLAEDFSLHPSPSNAAALPVPTPQPAESAREREGRCVSVLTAYEQLLNSWKECRARSGVSFIRGASMRKSCVWWVDRASANPP